MGLVNQKYSITITDDFATDPVITQVVNFTESAYDNCDSKTVKILAGAEATWQEETPTLLFDYSTSVVPQNAKYVMLVTDTPIYLWAGKIPEIVDGSIVETNFPKTIVKNFLALSGSTPKIYAVNPSRGATAPTPDLHPVDAHIKMVLVYA